MNATADLTTEARRLFAAGENEAGRYALVEALAHFMSMYQRGASAADLAAANVALLAAHRCAPARPDGQS